MSSDSTETEESGAAASGSEAPEARSERPLAGGRRLGDDPFLPDEGLFWWLPRTFSLLVVAVALMLLGGHFFGGEEVAPTSANEQPSHSPPAPQATPVAVVPAAPLSVSPIPAQGISPLHARPRVSPAHPQSGSLDASRSYNARRRAFLQEGEALLRALPPEGTGDLESARDRRALREFIQRMDTPAR
jgi:hypothetical protein